MAERRLFKEYNQYIKTPPQNQNHQILSLAPNPKNSANTEEDIDIFAWTAVITKPTKQDSQYYYNGKWKLAIELLSKYPLHPPQIHFITPINHPNINFETGEICLDILKQDNWSPAWNLEHLVVAILMLLDDPEPDSPLNIDLANLYRHDKLAFESLVQYTIWKTKSLLHYEQDAMSTGIKDSEQSAQKTESTVPLTPNIKALDSTISELELLKQQIKPPKEAINHPKPHRTKSSNLKVIHDVGEEVRKQFIAKVNEIGHAHSSTSSHDYSDHDSDLEPVREQVAKNVTKQVERLCSQSASPDPEESEEVESSEDDESDSDETRILVKEKSENDETVEKVRQQFIKQVDEKVNEVRKKQEEYQRARKRKH